MIKDIDNIYDEFLNIRTGNEESDFYQDRKIYNKYEPTRYTTLEDLFKKYTFNTNDHFVDFGCGKGRVLIMAAYYSCKYITGYELDTERYTILLENIKSFKNKFDNDSIFSAFNMNVEKMIVDDTANKFFFFNPFHLKVYIKVINAIQSSLQRNKREIYIYLYQPSDRKVKFMNSLSEYKVENKYERSHLINQEKQSNIELIIYSNKF